MNQHVFSPLKLSIADQRPLLRNKLLTVALMAMMCLLVAVALAKPDTTAAIEGAPRWNLVTQSGSSNFHPGDSDDFYEITAVDVGSADTAGEYTISDVLPSGLKVVAVSAYAEILGANDAESISLSEGCSTVTMGEKATVTCSSSESVPIGRQINIVITVAVPSKASGTLTNEVAISGGGASSIKVSNQTQVTQASQPVPYGASLTTALTDAHGNLDTQAGSHPFMFNSLLTFPIASVNSTESCLKATTPSCGNPNAQAKDIETMLPPGFVGNPTAVPYCTQAQFEIGGFENCPSSSQVGTAYLYFYGQETSTQYAPVYNIEPPPNQPAELGFSVSAAAHIPIFFRVRSESDYGLTAYVADVNQFDAVRAVSLSIWGEPTDSAHNSLRSGSEENCGRGSRGCASTVLTPKPFLTMPTACASSPLSISLDSDSWQEPEATPKLRSSSPFPAMTNCGALAFNPTINAAPTSHQANASTGYKVNIGIPQNESIEGLATPDVRNVEVALPQGTVISPSGANGLAACSESQFGLKVRAKGGCPSASKVGTVKFTTPVLKQPLTGNVYVGSPACSPCTGAQAESGQLVHLFIEAEGAGVIVKLSGQTKINESTGRLTTVFTENPQLPVSEIEVSLEPGADAPLANPSSCGAATTTAALTPWSSSSATNIASPPVSIQGCSSSAFAPLFRAGTTTSSQAGAFSSFAVTLSRQENEQDLGTVGVTMPAGLLGIINGVEQCPEEAANAGTCSAASQIGTNSVTAGPGTAPLTINGGKVYLTGPYGGEPFGLSIVTPAEAGPFRLSGNTGQGTEVVRAAIAVNPYTSALTITSGQLPQQLDGIPLQIRSININVNREGFMFNATDCKAMAIAGTITSASGTTSSTTFPYQAANCASLPFKPTFSASTVNNASKANGASLQVKVGSGAGQANIGQVKVDLPIQLPSRLTTLQKACTEAVFYANPAACPEASVVGTATAVTPVLKGALTGPAYLVSHGGAAFPDLEIVLQGEGITLILDGNTYIKKGITSSAFKAVPDAPVSSFSLSLPEGPHSILAANGSFCSKALEMPTEITGQNGAVVKQTTKIAVSGCPKQVKAKKKTKTKAKKKKK